MKKVTIQNEETKERLCCTNPLRDSLCESSVAADGDEQLGPYKVQDQELVILQ